MPISPSQQNRRSRNPDASARIGALATLPVFFDLNDKPVLLIGGTEAATWKAELLTATGANVEVHAPEFCDEMQILAARTDLNGSIKLIAQPWSLQALPGKSLVIGDAETEGAANAIYCAARAAGIPVNVIDKPAYCTFKFGTIVNRSPVVIGISTDGAAPVLGQAIRTRVEALLPASLAQWTNLAKEIRQIVLQRFAAGAERRQFWAKFAKLAFGPFVEADAWQIVNSGFVPSRLGSVTVMKIPSHDPGLLTLNAVRLLQNADTIYYDSNVNMAILDHARRESARHRVDNPDLSVHHLELIASTISKSFAQGLNILLVRSGHTNSCVLVKPLVTQLEMKGISVGNAGSWKPKSHKAIVASKSNDTAVARPNMSNGLA